MVFEPQPEDGPLIEWSRLWRCVGKRKRRLIGLACLGKFAPHGIASAHQVATVEVVAGVDVVADLISLGQPRVEVPVISARHVNKIRSIDVDRRRFREASGRFKDY